MRLRGGHVAVTALRRTQPVLKLDSHGSGDARRVASATGAGAKSPILADLDLTLD